jgi:RNA polymerase sigma-B factor
MSTRTRHRTSARPPRAQHAVNSLIAAWRSDGDEHARDEVFAQFSPLARRLARRYRTAHEPFEDLLQVAFVGLLGAMERFDPSRGTSFGSFAIPTILGELKKHFRKTGWAVHVPRGQQEMALHLEQATREIVARTGRQPSVRELGEWLEVSTEDVLAGLDAGAAHYAVSLDGPLAPGEPDDPDRLIDTIGRDEDGYALRETTASLASALARLPYGERRALSLRLSRNLKQTEIAAELGCSQMQVSRLLRRAAARVRDMIASPRAELPSPRASGRASARPAAS